jgi:hypothetical protein
MSNTNGSKKLSDQNLPIDSNYYYWVSVVAYFKAETRNFKSGIDLDNWLAAETQYTKLLIKEFLLRCEEDGGISTADLEELAHVMGVNHPEHLNTELKLIREIQKTSHHRPCFQSKNRIECKENECQWRSECQKLIASWVQ